MQHFQIGYVSTNINSLMQKFQGGKSICNGENRIDVLKAQR